MLGQDESRKDGLKAVLEKHMLLQEQKQVEINKIAK